MTTLKHYPIPPDLPACVFKQMVVVLRILQIEPMTIRRLSGCRSSVTGLFATSCQTFGQLG